MKTCYAWRENNKDPFGSDLYTVVFEADKPPDMHRPPSHLKHLVTLGWRVRVSEAGSVVYYMQPEEGANAAQ